MAVTDDLSNTQDLLAPLSVFRGGTSHDVPPVQWLAAEDLPQPYRDLLAHDTDMTSTLEEFFQASIRLQPLHLHRTPDFVSREVLLVSRDTGMPVEYGAIRIHMAPFTTAQRERIRRSVQPLGAILAHYNIEAQHRLGGFFRIIEDVSFLEPLHIHVNGSKDSIVLYGRSNRIFTADNCPLAEVVEILPPLDHHSKE